MTRGAAPGRGGASGRAGAGPGRGLRRLKVSRRQGEPQPCRTSLRGHAPVSAPATAVRSAVAAASTRGPESGQGVSAASVLQGGGHMQGGSCDVGRRTPRPPGARAPEVRTPRPGLPGSRSFRPPPRVWGAQLAPPLSIYPPPAVYPEPGAEGESGGFRADLLSHWPGSTPAQFLSPTVCVPAEEGGRRASDTEQTHAPHAKRLAQTPASRPPRGPEVCVQEAPPVSSRASDRVKFPWVPGEEE